jgi:hypothetical protein
MHLLCWLICRCVAGLLSDNAGPRGALSAGQLQAGISTWRELHPVHWCGSYDAGGGICV